MTAFTPSGRPTNRPTRETRRVVSLARASAIGVVVAAAALLGTGPSSVAQAEMRLYSASNIRIAPPDEGPRVSIAPRRRGPEAAPRPTTRREGWRHIVKATTAGAAFASAPIEATPDPVANVRPSAKASTTRLDLARLEAAIPVPSDPLSTAPVSSALAPAAVAPPKAVTTGPAANIGPKSPSGGWPALTIAAPRDSEPALEPASGRIGFALVDLATQQIIERRRLDTPFIPASVAKAPTALYALETLGPDHVFETRLVATGRLSNGVLTGDLHLVAGGDPTLDTADLGKLAEGLVRSGVKRVEGRFFFDAGPWLQQESIEPGQPIHAAYNPPLSGLNLNFNRVLFEWERGSDGLYKVEMRAHASKRSIRAEEIDGLVMPPGAHPSPFRYRRPTPDREVWQISTELLGRRGSRWLPVKQPSRYTATTFRTLAAETGVILPPPAPAPTPALDPSRPDGARVIARHLSDPLIDILRGMLKYSTNLTAETLGLAASERRGLAPLSIDGSARMMADWLQQRYAVGAPTSATSAASWRLMNHSGLAPSSRMTPLDAATLMSRVAASDISFTGYFELLPRYKIRGVKNMEIRAKTGTMYFGRGLSGYFICNTGARYAFAMFNSDIPRRDDFDRTFDPLSNDKPDGGNRWLNRARRVERETLKAWSARYCDPS